MSNRNVNIFDMLWYLSPARPWECDSEHGWWTIRCAALWPQPHCCVLGRGANWGAPLYLVLQRRHGQPLYPLFWGVQWQTGGMFSEMFSSLGSLWWVTDLYLFIYFWLLYSDMISFELAVREMFIRLWKYVTFNRRNIRKPFALISGTAGWNFLQGKQLLCTIQRYAAHIRLPSIIIFYRLCAEELLCHVEVKCNCCTFQVIVQFQPTATPDEWGTTQDGQTRPRVVKRGVDDDHDEVPDGEWNNRSKTFNNQFCSPSYSSACTHTLLFLHHALVSLGYASYFLCLYEF